ncbi:MAG: fasciclin domain-containing protein, partial [Gammaproteobacteria bacterium]|nr:fasciclin domain-containing protein [Gammaproteobacteria bacterium]NIM72555.1 fasciclin domain-containing protein [Gammaproteobacteria bacterium]NIN37587.1 fasciclin domain-containing protein [Gammaproteobacteria bacterium]NIO24314.1 fasciclin domain-containing protein [Gammaproteobacteria bacterium]NIO64919.1 fasciclin domain-containing protein [Gammaproteobacteria bacterium]
FDSFCDLIERAGMVDTFEADGPITVFAPDDAAFERMSAHARRSLEDPAKLRAL